MRRATQAEGHPSRARVATLRPRSSPPVEVNQGDLSGPTGPRSANSPGAGPGPPREMRWSVAAVWATFARDRRGMWHATQSSPPPSPASRPRAGGAPR